MFVKEENTMSDIEIIEVDETITDQITVPHCHHAQVTLTFAWA